MGSTDRNVVLIVGPPGAGKSTAAQQLVATEGLTHLEREMYPTNAAYQQAVKQAATNPTASLAVVRCCPTLEEQQEWEALTKATRVITLDVDQNTCIERIRQRGRSTWEDEMSAVLDWHRTRQLGATPTAGQPKEDAMSDPGNTTPEPSTEEPGQPTPNLEDPGKRALDAERRARREAEKAHKEATAELDNLRKQFMTDQERAVLEAKEAGRTEALTAMGGRLVEAEFRVAAAGRIPTETLNHILGAIDAEPFVDQAGQPNSKAIQEFVEGIAPAEREPDPLDLGQGSRGQPYALNSDPLLRDLKNHLGIR